MKGEWVLSAWRATTADCAVLSGAPGLIIKMLRPDGTLVTQIGVRSDAAVTGLLVVGMTEVEFKKVVMP